MMQPRVLEYLHVTELEQWVGYTVPPGEWLLVRDDPRPTDIKITHVLDPAGAIAYLDTHFVGPAA